MKKTVFALALVMALALPQMLQAQADGPTTGTRWTYLASPVIGAADLNGITFGNGKYVVVGASGICYSTDGLVWTKVAGFETRYLSVVFGGGNFVAVGANSTIAYSKDGVKWTAVANKFFTGSISEVAFGNNMFVAVGSKGTIVYAAANNPAKWTVVADSPFGTSTIYTVANHFDTFYAAGADGKMAYSVKDIKKWTPLIANPFQGNYNYTIWRIAPGPQGSGTWVAVSDNGIITATAGTNWKLVADSDVFDTGFKSVTYGGDRFVAVAQNEGTIVWSKDGVNWTLPPDVARNIAPDGKIWPMPTGIRLSVMRFNNVRWLNNRFNVVGAYGVVLYSY